MSRIRTVKPEFFRHWELYCAERAANTKRAGKPYLNIRIAFAALFTVADREGRFKWKHQELKVDCLPHDPIDFQEVLEILRTHGSPPFIRRYIIGGRTFGVIETFTQHQVINNRESQSRLPAPPDRQESDACPTRAPRVKGACKVAASGEGKEGREGKERKGQRSAAARPPAKSSPAGGKPHQIDADGGKSAPRSIAAADPDKQTHITQPEPLPEPQRVACLLRNLILSLDPKAKVPPLQSKIFNRWIVEADRMLRIDRRDIDEVVPLMRWAHDAEFWQPVILSVAKFREKYTTLLLQFKRARKAGETAKVPVCVVCQIRKPGKPDKPGGDVCAECAYCRICGAGADRFFIEDNPNGTKKLTCRQCHFKKTKSEAGGRHPGLVASKDLASEVLKKR